MDIDDRHCWDAVAKVIEAHGADAADFARGRLSFCESVDFQEGIALWRGVLDRLEMLAERSVRHH